MNKRPGRDACRVTWAPEVPLRGHRFAAQLLFMPVNAKTGVTVQGTEAIG